MSKEETTENIAGTKTYSSRVPSGRRVLVTVLKAGGMLLATDLLASCADPTGIVQPPKVSAGQQPTGTVSPDATGAAGAETPITTTNGEFSISGLNAGAAITSLNDALRQSSPRQPYTFQGKTFANGKAVLPNGGTNYELAGNIETAFATPDGKVVVFLKMPVDDKTAIVGFELLKTPQGGDYIDGGQIVQQPGYVIDTATYTDGLPLGARGNAFPFANVTTAEQAAMYLTPQNLIGQQVTVDLTNNSALTKKLVQCLNDGGSTNGLLIVDSPVSSSTQFKYDQLVPIDDIVLPSPNALNN